jgi:hypothetical protein
MSERNWKFDVKAIRRILPTEWNPIGFGAFDVPDDEYDSYIGGIYGRMQSGVSVEELAQHLSTIESDQMGLAVNSRVSDRNLQVANALLALMD